MGRVNKTIKSAFADLTGSDTRPPAYDAFINSNNPKKPSDRLAAMLNDYKGFVDEHRKQLERISLVEEIIMQLRTYENITDIRLSNVRNYIYGRCPFYRKDIKTKDVRVVIESSDIWDKLSIKELYDNKEFMKRVKASLREKMSEIIEENIDRLQQLNLEIAEAEIESIKSEEHV
jgi:hypothetical protein